jgi:hypothetical protein
VDVQDVRERGLGLPETMKPSVVLSNLNSVLALLFVFQVQSLQELSSRRTLLKSFVVSTVGFPTLVHASEPTTFLVPASKKQNDRQAKLEPIMQLRGKLTEVKHAISALDAKELTLNIPSTELSFKAIFDDYSDPISYKQKFLNQNAFLVYYTKGFDGPGRPNIESDLPVKQTLQFGSRNDAWAAWEDAMAEIAFQVKNPQDENVSEISNNIQRVIEAIDRYLIDSESSQQ